MYATIFRINLCSSSSRDRGRAGRSLATALDTLHGFVAFIALEADDGQVAGLCICDDPMTLQEAQTVAAHWQRDRCGPSSAGLQPIAVGKVIVQRGF